LIYLAQKFAVPKARSSALGKSVLVGIRPEKFRIAAEGKSTHGNVLTGGVISDVSYIGVSTQYQVEMPSGKEIMVFEQNDDDEEMLPKGSKGCAFLGANIYICFGWQ
jgi:spermidine/putrescine transport system ATP-binding protein